MDTPGFSEVGIWGIDPRSSPTASPSSGRSSATAATPTAAHAASRAAGCEAVEGGAIAPDRHESYLALLAELEGAPEEWE